MNIDKISKRLNKYLEPDEEIISAVESDVVINTESLKGNLRKMTLVATDNRVIIPEFGIFGVPKTNLTTFEYDEISEPQITITNEAVSIHIYSEFGQFLAFSDDELKNILLKQFSNEVERKYQSLVSNNTKSLYSNVVRLRNEEDDLIERISHLEGIFQDLSKESKDLLKKYHTDLLFELDDIEHIPSSHDLQTELTLVKLKEKEIPEVKSLLSDEDVFKSRDRKAQQRQLIRLFNAESNIVFSKMTSKNAEASHTKLVKIYEQLNKLFEIDDVKINHDLLVNKLDQLTLITKYNIAVEQEKLIRKEERERIAEEQKAERELSNALSKLDKEEKQFKSESDKLMKYMQNVDSEVEKEVYANKIKELQEKLTELQNNKVSINQRLENTRAGYVYIISNIGSFGEDVYKIGVTRRLEPIDRVKELSSASVPFDFDIHAIIFSDDAPKLENTLHKYFRKNEVNKMNTRKEFFKVNLEEIKKVVLKEHNDTVRFEMHPEAYQYRESLKLINSENEEEVEDVTRRTFV